MKNSKAAKLIRNNKATLDKYSFRKRCHAAQLLIIAASIEVDYCTVIQCVIANDIIDL